MRRAIPIAIALTLAAPVFAFPFLWDDFDFLGRTQVLELTNLLPDPQTLYYRPLSREVYFTVLHLLGTSPVWGHVLNAAALAGIIALLFHIVRRVAGVRAALFASMIFSTMGANPTLIGWVSGSQDVLAMLFTLGAIVAQVHRRTALGLLLFLCGLLSKETAAAMLPAILIAGYLGDRRPSLSTAGPYLLITAAWLLIHPAPRLLPYGPTREEALGSETVGAVASLGREILAVLNVPLGMFDTDYLFALLPYAAVAAALLLFGLHQSARTGATSSGAPSLRGPLTLGLATAVPTTIMAGLLPLVWSPYYACMPALGFSMVMGAVLARTRMIIASSAVIAYFTLGLLSRSVGLEPIVTSEPHLHSTGEALSKVERGFRALRPDFPERARVHVSAQFRGPRGIYTHLYRFQPLRIWYDEPSIFVLDPNQPLEEPGEPFLFWVTNDYEVFEVDLRTLEPRSSGPPPDLFAYQKTLRTFALGLASAGRTDEAVRILLQMGGRPPEVRVYDRRTAAALLIATDRREDAEDLLRAVPSFTRVEALDATFAILHEPVPGLDMDDAVMEAFGLSPADIEANRMLMQAFDQNGFSESAIRFARRLLRLVPEDPEALQVLRKWEGRRKPIRISVPIPHR